MSYATAVSADGSVVVGRSDYDYNPSHRWQAFRWTQATRMVGLGFLPGGTDRASAAYHVLADGSTVFGYSFSSLGTFAFRWTQATGMVPLGAPGDAVAASADGRVVVGEALSPHWNGSEAWRWTETSLTWLGDLPGGYSESHAWDVSADGSIVVGMSDSSVGREAFIWDAAHGMRSLKRVLVNLYAPNAERWTLTAAWGISGDGTVIVGQGVNPAGQEEAWLATLLPPSVGDVNCDAEVNNFDIDPFVLALTDPAGYKAAYPGCDRMLADINRDGVVDNFDIDPFVKLLAP